MSVLFRRSIHISTAALLALLLVLAACTTVTNSTVQNVPGSGALKVESRTVTGFSRIDLRSSGSVVVTVSDSEAVTVSAEDNFLPLLTTRVENGWLLIETPPNTNLQPTLPITISVTLKSLSDVTLSGSGIITIMDLSADALETTISGNGNVMVTGTIVRQQVTLSGSGIYDASGVTGEDAVVTLNGSGNVLLTVTATLDATISGSGTIAHSGGAKVTQNITGTGQVVER